MSKTFCLKPFRSVYVERNGDYVACGHSYSAGKAKDNINQRAIEDAWNGEYYKNLRLDLINGVKNENCKICWEREERGFTSARQKTLKNITEEKIEQISNQCILDNGAYSFEPNHLGLKLENTCNLKCITCNHYQSSQHEKEVKFFKQQNIKLPSYIEFIEKHNEGNFYSENYITENLEKILKSFVVIELQGGEPLISRNANELLDFCIKNNYTNLKISTTSNLSSLPNTMIDKLKKFKELQLWISWDHIDSDKFNFIRYPARYEAFVENLSKVKELNAELGISFTVSIFNVFDIEQIVEEFERVGSDLGITWQDINFRYVMAPDYFSIDYLEYDQKKQVFEIIDNILNKKSYILDKHSLIYDVLTRLKNSLTPTPITDFNEVVKERTRVLDLYDQARGTDYRKLFPYIKRYE